MGEFPGRRYRLQLGATTIGRDYFTCRRHRCERRSYHRTAQSRRQSGAAERDYGLRGHTGTRDKPFRTACCLLGLIRDEVAIATRTIRRETRIVLTQRTDEPC